MTIRGPIWSCPGNRARGPLNVLWCNDMPCHGHRPTKDQLLVAKVLAWQSGQDWDACPQRAFLTSAREALHDVTGLTGVPR